MNIYNRELEGDRTLLKGCDLCSAPNGKEVHLRYPSYKALLCGNCFNQLTLDIDEFRRHWVKVRKAKK